MGGLTRPRPARGFDARGTAASAALRSVGGNPATCMELAAVLKCALALLGAGEEIVGQW